MQIDCRDGKYRYKFYDLMVTPQPNAYTNQDYVLEGFINNLLGKKPDNAFSKGQSKKMIISVNKAVLSAIESLNKAMVAKPDNF
ncbi:hypothetical protein FFF34_019455 [Inquilinus sp. KBS0705]|nr:hypothetical protein FFF34_019455 [Inquilinus sp. KBS0705]